MAKLEATYELKEVDGGWEYEVFLWRGTTILDMYDSDAQPSEHPLTRQQAKLAAKEIVKDVKRGKASDWFTEVLHGAGKEAAG